MKPSPCQPAQPAPDNPDSSSWLLLPLLSIVLAGPALAQDASFTPAVSAEVSLTTALSAEVSLTTRLSAETSVRTAISTEETARTVAESGQTPSTPSAVAPTLANISARAHVSEGDKILVPGFVVEGTAGQKKRVLVRAVGLRMKDFGIPQEQLLADPVLELFRIVNNVGVSIGNNDNWVNATNATEISDTCHAVGAFSLDGRPSGTFDQASAALLMDLEPGSYTAQASGKNGGTGVALVEVYDVSGPNTRLVNVSNRGFVGTGFQLLVPGFVVGGTAPKTYLIRGVGPGLKQFFGDGYKGLLEDPLIEIDRIVDGVPQRIGSNDNWASPDNSPATVAATATQVRAFPLVEGAKDAALVVTLQPGLYTVTCKGVGDSTGVALVEVYEVP